MENWNFQELLIIGLIGALFFKEVVTEYIRHWFKLPPKNGAELKNLMVDLKGHFNDTTTDLLSKINDGVGKLNNKHEEWDKYGIPTRECKKDENQ